MTFNRDVTACVFTATPGVTGDVGAVLDQVATVAAATGEPDGVYVLVQSTNADIVNSSFHLTVICPTAAAPSPTGSARGTASSTARFNQ